MTRLSWLSPSTGRIELELTLDEARSASHAGDCEADVRNLSETPAVAAQLAAADPAVVRMELAEYGAWTDEDLADHGQNLQRLLWLAAGDIAEEAAAAVER